MTGLVRKATLLTAAGLLAASAAMAGVPSAANSNVPSCVSLVGSAAGVPDALGTFTVTVRDLANNPLSGASVVVDLSACLELSLCNDQLDANALVNCASKTTRKFTDGLGQVTFTVLGGGTFIPVPPPGFAKPASTFIGGGRIFANGTLIGSPTVAAYNLDGQLGVAGGDLAVFLTDFASGQPYGRSDFDCNGAIGGGDLSFWLTGFAGLGSLTFCSTTSCPSP
jgi:hypothetical protein